MISKLLEYSLLIVILWMYSFCKPFDGEQYGLNQYNSLTGSTMGTSYKIKFSRSKQISKEEIQNELNRIEDIFSTYNPRSEVSQLNQSKKKSTSIQMSLDLQNLLILSQYIQKESNGAFSVGLGRLVEYWGFGNTSAISKDEKRFRFDSNKRIQDILKCSGKENYNCSKKKNSKLMDFSGIAKGYAIDKISLLLKEKEIYDYMIEIGGEVCVSTQRDPKSKPNNRKWKIGITNPENASKIYKILQLSKGCIATSGNGEQFFMVEGKRYTHIIDPRSGLPIERSISSVSVYDDGSFQLPGARSDAWATAFYVLGLEEGLLLANQKDMAVMYLQKTNGTFVEFTSRKWKQYFENHSIGVP